MDAIIVSKENTIFHISIEDNKADYSFYNPEGHLLDGGVLDIDNLKGNNDIVNEIISSFKETINFSSPFVYLSKENSEELLEYIEEENYNYIQEKIKSLSESNDNSILVNDEMDIDK